MKCQSCGFDLQAEAKFCAQCGARIKNSSGETSSDASKVGEVKVRGWLLFFCVLITIVFPLSSCSGLAEYGRATDPGGISKDSAVYGALAIHMLGVMAVGATAFFSGIAIWRGSRKGRVIAIAFLCAYPTIMLAFNALAWGAVDGDPAAGPFRMELINSVVGPIIFSAVWLAYFLLSKRVRSTYG